jgi:predicted dehydrogenase
MRDPKVEPSGTHRRAFLQTATAAAAATITIVPRHVLGGAGYVPPSEKINLAYIGTGTQGVREMPGLLANPEIQVVAVCDPCKEAVGYRDWSKDGLLADLRRSLGKSDWRAEAEGTIPGGREAGKAFVDAWYTIHQDKGTFQGCSAFADVRELLDKQSGLDAVKIMTPDHLHGIIAIAAMKRGKHVMTHKPISNRLKEGQRVIDIARSKGVATLLLAWDANRPLDNVVAWINSGAIGTLREIHNWSSRPVWPQYAAVPTDRPPVPKGFDWDLWLGPEAERPYHPDYTHMVFRGWYDFGGGSMADMGHYSLWNVFNAFDLAGPIQVEPTFSHACAFDSDNVAMTLPNRDAFPLACRVLFRFPARGERPAIDLFWHDGGTKPPTPDELEEDGAELEAEGMMFVGDKGKILAGFHGDNPRLIPERRMRELGKSAGRDRSRAERHAGQREWIAAVRGGPQPAGSFLNAGPLTEAMNLYAVALRTGRRLNYDPVNSRVTNVPEANAYLDRNYRKGWEPESI